MLCAAVVLTVLSTSCSLRLPVEKQPVSRSFTPANPTTAPQSAPCPHVLVWLVSDGYHTGMVFPFDWLLESGFIPPADFQKNSTYVTLSWGNRDAYSIQGIDTMGKWMRVLFTPTPSVMELIPLNWDVAQMMPKHQIWRKVVERHHGYSIATFLNGCTRKLDNGQPVVVTRSSWGEGVQLECSHSYFIPRVCNIWTAQAIESMGGDVSPMLSITANGLARQAEKPANGYELIWPGGGRPKPMTP